MTIKFYTMKSNVFKYLLYFFLCQFLLLSFVGIFIKVECDSCSGKGSFKEYQECRHCSGDGESRCIRCKGKKELQCYWYEKIEREAGSWWSIDPYSCSVSFYCRGGKIDTYTKWYSQSKKCMIYTLGNSCFECNGRGFVQCGGCFGDGKVKCKHCKGKGGKHTSKTCNRCDGSGKIELYEYLGVKGYFKQKK